MTQTIECPICKSQAESQVVYEPLRYFYACPICGRFEFTETDLSLQNDNRLAHYLYYNRFLSTNNEVRFHTTMSNDLCDYYKNNSQFTTSNYGRPVHMDLDIIDLWYPKTFADRIDRILMRIDSLLQHVGQSVVLSFPELTSLLFVDRKDECTSPLSEEACWRHDIDCIQEAVYMLNYLMDCEYIQRVELQTIIQKVSITLTPKGYARVDELQKNSSNGKNVLVAMQFGDRTKDLREAIRKGINDSGYHAIFIDEVQHNDFITPELLKNIRDSRFVVVDLTHQNNGAYFEEGYALGRGKPVIQLCQKGVSLHFDIAQKNTIMWENESDIPERLTNRIKATID